MAYIPKSPPRIAPLPENCVRPKWSVMIPVYNCAQFLPETLQSVLQQNIPETEMQIEVVDDGSTDADVEALVKQLGQGRIAYYRQPKNVGSLVNFETCLIRAKGQFVHLLHGDDKVRNGYYRKIETLFAKHPEAGAAFCRYACIDENGRKNYDKTPEMQQDGILPNWLKTISERQRLQYATITVRREVYEKLGGFFGVTYGEDWEMWVRIARHYPVAYTPEVLAEYRTHSNSISGHKFLKGGHLKDLAQAMQLIQQHLPEEQKTGILARSKKYYAYYGLKIANRLWNSLHNEKVVKTQIKYILYLHQSPLLRLVLLKLYLKLNWYKLWKRAYR